MNRLSLTACALSLLVLFAGCTKPAAPSKSAVNTTSVPAANTPDSKTGEAKTEEPAAKTNEPEQVAKADPSTENGGGPAVKTDPMDWPFWRGPERNGISREKGIVDEWDPDNDTNVLWKSTEYGSRSTPIVMRGKLYCLCRHKPGTLEEAEKVVCLDAATGKLKWEHVFNAYLTDVPDTRVGWSNVTGDPETGNVYALGVCGAFFCFNGETGEVIWNRSLSEEFGLLSTYGGRTNTPILVDDQVIISGVIIGWGATAKPTDRQLSFDKRTGATVWINGTTPLPSDTTYSTPILGVINHQLVAAFGSGDGYVHSMQPRTGKLNWKFHISSRGLNSTPLLVGDTIYIGNTEENYDDTTMGCLAAIRGGGAGDVTKTNEIWRIKEMSVGRSSPVQVNDKIYAATDTGKLMVLDAKTGEEIDRVPLGTIMRSSLLYADGKLFVNEMNGRSYIFKINEDGSLEELQRIRIPDTEIHAAPVVSHGRLYMQTTECLYCVGRPDQKPQADPIPPQLVEPPVSEDPKPAWLQLVPAEALIKPGEKIEYSVRLYNARGQFLKQADDFTLSVDENGSVDGATFTADPKAAHVASNVTAKVGDLKGEARVRIVPDLPWKFDFEDNNIPITWIGMRYRHQTREVDGNHVMVKITTIPLGTRSQGWIGPIDLHDYTIQGDVLGKNTNDKLPDIGLQAQRYRLEMRGADQKLKIYSWVSHDKKFQEVPFDWQGDKWYTMKFKAAVEERDGKKVAVLKGKVWPRGEDEPEKWSIEYVDPVPNETGSPGAFGNAKDSELFIDNLTVTPNS